MEGNYNFNNERRVDSCVLEASTERSSHLGESFPFYSDSGAERSLIKESAASRFSGKGMTDILVMRGVGNTCVKHTPPICSLCVLMIFTLKIISHVLADSYLKYDVAISCGTLSLVFDVTLHKIASLCVKQK